MRRLYLALFLVFAVALFVVVFRYPFDLGYVDDWVLTELATKGTSFLSPELLADYNGHPQTIGKLLTLVDARFFSLNLFLFSVLGAALVSGAAALVVADVVEEREGNHSLWELTTMVLCCLCLAFSGRQMQNITQLICFDWNAALFFICLFVFTSGRKAPWRVGLNRASIILGPFTIGLGLVIPLYVLVRFAASFVFRKRRESWVSPALALVSLAGAVILPILVRQAPVVGFQDGFFHFAAQHPGKVIRFFLAATGSLFVPWSTSYIHAATWVGVVSYATLGWVLFRQIKVRGVGEAASSLIIDQPLLVMGLTFLALLTLARAHLLGLDGTVEARYTTGTVVLQLGLFRYVLANAREAWPQGWKVPLAAGAAAAGFAYVLGMTGHMLGVDWVRTRHLSSAEVVQCFRDHQREPISASHPCVDSSYRSLFFSGTWYDRDKYVEQLSVMSERRWSFFRDL